MALQLPGQSYPSEVTALITLTTPTENSQTLRSHFLIDKRVQPCFPKGKGSLILAHQRKVWGSWESKIQGNQRSHRYKNTKASIHMEIHSKGYDPGSLAQALLPAALRGSTALHEQWLVSGQPSSYSYPLHKSRSPERLTDGTIQSRFPLHI